MNTLILVGGSTPVQRSMEQRVASRLRQRGLEVHVCDRLNGPIGENGLIVTEVPLKSSDWLLASRVLGQRTLNRKERLVVAERAGLKVARWSSPENTHEMSKMLGQWGVDRAVIKYDWSERRNGVFLCSGGDLPQDFDPSCDVCMEFLFDDPLTYKVDLFGDQILGCWILPTRSMLQNDWHAVHGEISAFRPPRRLLTELRGLGLTLLESAAGYVSVDLMRHSGEFQVIELNTCGVGTEMTWNKWPDAYERRYARALERTLSAVQRIPFLGKVATIAADGCGAFDDSQDRAPSNADDEISLEAGFLQSLSISQNVVPDVLFRHQREIASELLRHAYDHVPFYKSRLAGVCHGVGNISWERWNEVPFTRDGDILSCRMDLISRQTPLEHGASVHRSSLTSGQQWTTLTTTRLACCAADAIWVRCCQWHGLDFSKPFASIQNLPADDSVNADWWGPRWVTSQKGRLRVISELTALNKQMAWLKELEPSYLETSVANLAQLMPHLKETELPTFYGIITKGDPISIELRSRVEDTLGAKLISCHTNDKTEFISIQCPTAPLAYHLQSEICVIEIVGDDGSACAVGERGTLVVTPLYNFAMPLIRYWTGQLATLVEEYPRGSAACSCGCRLPKVIYDHFRGPSGPAGAIGTRPFFRSASILVS